MEKTSDLICEEDIYLFVVLLLVDTCDAIISDRHIDGTF